MLRRTRRLLLVSLFACSAHAAELGDPRVSSHIGQQLVADIELTMLEDAATPVQVHLASPEVYSEAGIAVPPVLSTLNLSVMRRDGRQFLHATTLRPVEADHLHLYLALVDHGQRVVRLATLWLTPDPNPAPAPLPAPVPAPAPVLAAPAAPPVRPAPPPVRTRAEAEPAPPALAWARPAHTAAPAPSLPVPKPAPLFMLRRAPLPVHAPARPAACTPQSGEAEACIALGAKNAELRARIGQLEQRVKGLQARLWTGAGKAAPQKAQPQAPAAPETHAQQASRPVPPPGPLPISAIKPLLPHHPKAPPPDDGPPWAAIGGGLALLAAAGAAFGLVRARRQRSRNVDIPDAPGVLPRLRERFFARNGNRAVADPVAEPLAEPTLD